MVTDVTRQRDAFMWYNISIQLDASAFQWDSNVKRSAF